MDTQQVTRVCTVTCIVLAIVVMDALADSAAGGAEPPKPAEKVDPLVAGWLKVCSAHAEDYRIAPAGQPDKQFRRLPAPVFRHSQPVRGDDIGAVWLWVSEDGRPGAIGTVFAFSGGAGGGGYRHVAHEFHSLWEEPIVSRWRGKDWWSPKQRGIEWKPIPSAPVPAASAPERLRQMCDLARQFNGYEMDARKSRWELRLVGKPVYRYELKKPEVVQDGALFVLCQGTDPEIFLGIEACRTPLGYEWRYACAAFSDYKLFVRHQETEVWNPPVETYDNRTAPHWWNGAIERTRLPEDTRKPPAENAK